MKRYEFIFAGYPSGDPVSVKLVASPDTVRGVLAGVLEERRHEFPPMFLSEDSPCYINGEEYEASGALDWAFGKIEVSEKDGILQYYNNWTVEFLRDVV